MMLWLARWGLEYNWYSAYNFPQFNKLPESDAHAALFSEKKRNAVGIVFQLVLSYNKTKTKTKTCILIMSVRLE